MEYDEALTRLLKLDETRIYQLIGDGRLLDGPDWWWSPEGETFALKARRRSIAEGVESAHRQLKWTWRSEKRKQLEARIAELTGQLQVVDLELHAELEAALAEKFDRKELLGDAEMSGRVKFADLTPRIKPLLAIAMPQLKSLPKDQLPLARAVATVIKNVVSEQETAPVSALIAKIGVEELLHG